MVDVYGKLVKVGSEEDLESGDATFRLGFRLPTDDLVYCNVGPDVVTVCTSTGVNLLRRVWKAVQAGQ